MRQLASIKRINKLTPIEGRDRIKLATVDGWSVIVKKNEFNVGDLCVYIEIDSVVPETDTFEFLRKNKFRIKTMKMDGVISQGIVFPILDTNYILPDTVQEMLEYAHGTSRLANVLREGVVVRSQDGKQSFKAVDPLFLLKHDE